MIAPGKSKRRIGLIAGEGSLPLSLARAILAQGHEVITISFSREVQRNLAGIVPKNYLLGLGQANKIIAALKNEGIKEIVLIGKIDKKILFKRPFLDLKAIKLLTRLKNKNDAVIMSAIVENLKAEGIETLNQDIFLKDFLAPRGVLSKRIPCAREEKDIAYGFNLAKEIAGLDLGQTVVVKELIPLAVEALEGTDQAIERGCRLANGGAVIVKVSKKSHDHRYDLPTIGRKTIETIIKGKGSVLALEAEKTFVIDLPGVLRIADKAGLAIVAVPSGERRV